MLPRELPHMPGTLPAELTSFVGRERMLADMARLLDPDAQGCRLLTLTGPGGSGKTRVAVKIATSLNDQFEDGACFVALAPISDPKLVARTIAQTIGVRDAGGSAALESLKNYLQDRRMLLVLDNFEQVLAAAVEIPQLLAACARLQVIVTSRAALRVSGERELAVLPLELPGATAAPASQTESVRLFVDRARAVKPDFALTEQNIPVVAEICRRLDGLPLAIELAAARIRLLDPESMLARLVHRLPFLTGGARDLPTRQQTLRNTIAWSYELLTAQEQALFRAMSVFVGGCTLEALQMVSPDSRELLDDADSLVAKSLARSVVTAPGDIRLTMLETTREFGLEQLAWTGELDTLRWRHAEYFLALAEQAEPALWGLMAGTWHARLETEHDNIRAALEWGLSVSREASSLVALRLAGSLARFWWTRAHFGEGLGWLRRALAASPRRSRERTKALHAAAWLAHFMHDSATARALLEESLSIARELGDDWSIAWVIHLLGRVAYFEGDHAGASRLGEQSQMLAERVGDRWLIAWSLHLRGLAAHIGGDYALADTLYAQSMDIRVALGHREAIGVLCQLMGMSAQRQGDFVRARDQFRKYLEIGLELGSTFHTSNVLAQFGSLAAELGQPERGARLMGAAAAFHETSRTRAIPLTEALVVDGVDLARRALGDQAFAAASALGRTMSSEEAIAQALAVEPGARDCTAPAERPSPLSEREAQVARLVADGLSNRQIANELVITERTAEAHVGHILDKLGFASRTQIGVWAAARTKGQP